MPPVFLRVLNFLPFSQRNTSFQRTSGSAFTSAPAPVSASALVQPPALQSTRNERVLSSAPCSSPLPSTSNGSKKKSPWSRRSSKKPTPHREQQPSQPNKNGHPKLASISSLKLYISRAFSPTRRASQSTPMEPLHDGYITAPTVPTIASLPIQIHQKKAYASVPNNIIDTIVCCNRSSSDDVDLGGVIIKTSRANTTPGQWQEQVDASPLLSTSPPSPTSCYVLEPPSHLPLVSTHSNIADCHSDNKNNNKSNAQWLLTGSVDTLEQLQQRTEHLEQHERDEHKHRHEHKNSCYLQGDQKPRQPHEHETKEPLVMGPAPRPALLGCTRVAEDGGSSDTIHAGTEAITTTTPVSTVSPELTLLRHSAFQASYGIQGDGGEGEVKEERKKDVGGGEEEGQEMNGKDINKRDEHNPRHHHYAECSKDKQEQYNGQQYQQFDNRGDQLRRMDDTRIVQDKKKKAYGVHFSNSHYVFDSTFLPPVSLLPPLQTPSFSTANMPTAHECFPQSDLNEIGPRQTNGSKKCSGVEEVRETKETKEIKEIKGIKESKNIDLLKKDPTTRFQILEKLGSGSSGSSIFKALDRLDGMKPVALKKIPLLTLSDSLESNVPAQADVDAFINSIAYHNEDWGQGGDEVVREEYITDDGGDNSKSKIRQEGTRCLDRQPSNNWPISSMIASKIARKKGYNQVMKCQDCFLIGSELWLLLEFCAGGSVADLIRLSDGPLTESEIGWIMSQVLQGLTFLHSKDHVHGDIKAGNILLTMDGQVKLGGSGTVLNHKEGAGERKRRRRSLAMTEFPVSWLAPELNNSAVCCPSVISGTRVKNCPLGHDNTNNNTENPNSSSWTPRASTETDIWALGIACIELSQGRPPRPEMLLLAMLDEQKPVSHQQIALSSPAFDIVDRLGGIKFGGIGLESGSRTPGWESLQSTASSANESLGAVGLGMSEEMRSFIAKCLTPDPRTRPNVYDLLQDPFIIQNQGGSAELVERIQQMMEFVNQCASISSEMPLHLHNQHQSLPLHASSSLLPTVGSSASAAANSTSALTLSLSKASLMIDMDLDEASIGPWLIPMVRPRVDSVYDASSFFDQSGLPIAPPEPSTANHISHWKHQRVSHPVVKQALMCDQAGYMIFRHSRSPSLATIVESHLEDDSCSCNSTSIKDFECNTTNSSGNSSYNSNNGTGLHRIGSDDLKIDYGDNGSIGPLDSDDNLSSASYHDVHNWIVT